MSTVTDFSTSETSFILLLGRGQLPESLSSSAYLSRTSSQRFNRAFRASWDVLSEAIHEKKRYLWPSFANCTVDLEFFVLRNFHMTKFCVENFVGMTPYHINVNSVQAHELTDFRS